MKLHLPARPLRAALCLALCVVLSACGGGGGSPDAAGAGGTPPASATAELQATAGAAAESAHVQWRHASGSGPWTLERWHEGDAAPVTLATVAQPAGSFMDVDLSASTTYTYRLRDASGALVVQAAAATGDAPALRGDLGQTLGAPQTLALGAQAGESTAGALSLQLEAGSFSGTASARVQAHAHTLADGVGEAWAIDFDQAPQRPLAVALAYGADEDADEVDNQRLAARTPDGRWWLLPATRHDRAARRLAVTLPDWLLRPASSATSRGASAGMRAQAALADDSMIRVVLVRFVSLKLAPRQASLRVLGSTYFTPVATWDVNLWDCPPGDLTLCVPSVGLVQREFPVLNTKAGFERRWLLEGSTTPGPELGAITPTAPAGVLYRAPATVPATNPVMLRFESLDTRSGRRAVVSARIRISEDRWVGPMTLSNSVDDIGYYYESDTRWVLDPDASTDSVRIYRAQGRLNLRITPAKGCALTPLPDHVDVGPATGLTELEVDEVTGRYRLRFNATWPLTILNCMNVPMPSAGGVNFDQQGAVSGGRIRGDHQAGSVFRVWNLARPE